MTASEVESLEDRTVLDGDPYGGSGGYGSGSGSTGGTTPGGSGGGMTGGYSTAATGGLLRPNGQEWFETFGTDPLTGVVAVSRDLPGGLRLSYASDSAVTLPIVNIDTTWNSSSTLTGPLTASLVINGTTHSSVVLSQTGVV